MKYSGYLLFALASLCLPAAGRAESACPWINKATAFGILGSSEDSPMASLSEINATTCRFTYRSDGGVRELRITVEQAKDPEQAFLAHKTRCGSSASALPAIGNEAIMCSADKKGRSEEVIGRVRDNVFTILLSTTVEKDSILTKEVLVEKAGFAAEQISGNLF